MWRRNSAHNYMEHEGHAFQSENTGHPAADHHVYTQYAHVYKRLYFFHLRFQACFNEAKIRIRREQEANNYL